MVIKRFFGTTGRGEDVHAYTIENDRGISATVLDYGATLQSLVLPHAGEHIDVVLGYDTAEEYEQNDAYLGATIGRYAGRIPNARLNLDGTAYPLTVNEPPNHLHGGNLGFDRRVFAAVCTDSSVTFRLHSPAGDEGYPAALDFAATYALEGDVLSIVYRGAADGLTAWNPTNHAYWNLNGHDAGDARMHRLEIPADRYVPVDSACIPTGGEADVLGTRFDFRTLRRIESTYDHSFVLQGGTIRLFGDRGIGMEIETDCTAVQFYTAEYLSERKGKGGAIYRPFGAVCLETEGRQALRDVPIFAENVLRGKRTRTTKIQFLFE